jgi:hypothetical protein
VVKEDWPDGGTRRLYQEAAKEEGIEANVFRSQRSDADTNTLGNVAGPTARDDLPRKA